MPAQDAAPADRNAINTSTRPGDMMADSPVTFPQQGALPAQYPPDVKDRAEPSEKDYYIFSTPCRSLAQIAAIQQDMPPGQFTKPPADWTHLRRTRRILAEGGELRLLALGDSIVNDTMRSGWVAQLQEAYPKAAIQATVFVRGGGGCQHYREEGRVEKYIVPRNPDLVYIGGISQKDIASIGEVIRQLRAGLPDVEILLATGTFGTADPRDPATLAKAPHSGTGAMVGAQVTRRRRTLCLSRHDCALGGIHPLGEMHPHLFYRDVVHANEFGEQILAKIMMAFWTARIIRSSTRVPLSPTTGLRRNACFKRQRPACTARAAQLGMGMVYGWDDVNTTVSWDFPAKAGRAEVLILQAAEAVSAGHTYAVDVAGTILEGTVQDTGGWYSFREISLGSVEFSRAGEYELTVRPLKKGARGVMNLAGVILRGPAFAGLVLTPEEAEHPHWPRSVATSPMPIRAGALAEIPVHSRPVAGAHLRAEPPLGGHVLESMGAAFRNFHEPGILRVCVPIHRCGLQPKHIPVGHLLSDACSATLRFRWSRASVHSTTSTAASIPTARSPGRLTARAAWRLNTGATRSENRSSCAAAGSAACPPKWSIGTAGRPHSRPF